MEGARARMRPEVNARQRRRARACVLGLVCVLALASAAAAQVDRRASLPELTAPVNDFAGIIDEPSQASIDRTIRALQARTGDVITVVTIKDVAPFADVREYAVELFQNRGRGIGQREKDNGLLVLLSAGQRAVWVEVGYGLEGAITDGFAGDTSRQVMVPFFRQGQYGAGLDAGVARIAHRIAEDRGTTLDGVAAPAAAPRARRARPGIPLPVLIILMIIVLQFVGRRRRPHRRHWTGGPWSGWSGGVGPFGGTYGGWGGGGGGFSGGGFGGFGGGRSGGGGGGASW